MIQQLNVELHTIIGCNVEHSLLTLYNQTAWDLFCGYNNLGRTAQGVFIPGALMAYVNNNAPSYPAPIYHELFGHGIYHEHTVVGRHITELQQQGQQIQSIVQCVKPQYEGFAHWITKQCCDITDNKKLWIRTYDSIPTQHKQYYDNMDNQIQEFGLDMLMKK